MRQKQEYIEALLERFLEGQTSEAEEQTLADFFGQEEDVPAAWQVYQQMFQSFRTDMYDLSEDELKAMLTPAPIGKKMRIFRHGPWAAAACAAGVAMLLWMQPWKPSVAAPDMTTAELLEAITILAETTPDGLHITAKRQGSQFVVSTVGASGESGTFLLDKSSDGSGIELVSQWVNK